jgi:hypothetical protein
VRFFRRQTHIVVPWLIAEFDGTIWRTRPRHRRDGIDHHLERIVGVLHFVERRRQRTRAPGNQGVCGFHMTRMASLIWVQDIAILLTGLSQQAEQDLRGNSAFGMAPAEKKLDASRIVAYRS